MTKRYKIILIFLALMVFIIADLIVFVPWKRLAEAQLVEALDENGLKDVRLTVSELDIHHLLIKDVKAIDKSLEELVVFYSPIDLLLRKTGANLTAKAKNFLVNTQAVKSTIAEGDVVGKFTTDTYDWQGEWNLHDIQIETALAEVPLLQGQGDIKADDNNIILSGEIKSADQEYKIIFSFVQPLTEAEPLLKIVSAVVPWKGGKLFVENVSMPLSGDAPVKFDVQVQKVSVDALIQAMTGNRVSAQGGVSGKIPLVIGADGSFMIGEGSLRADSPGTLTVPTEAIPGDNPQIDVVRQVLQNFHYKELTISVNNVGKQTTLSITLNGSNPDAYNSRPVKLNVNLAGDVLCYIQQNMLLLTDPKSLLHQGKP